MSNLSRFNWNWNRKLQNTKYLEVPKYLWVHQLSIIPFSRQELLQKHLKLTSEEKTDIRHLVYCIVAQHLRKCGRAEHFLPSTLWQRKSVPGFDIQERYFIFERPKTFFLTTATENYKRHDRMNMTPILYWRNEKKANITTILMIIINLVYFWCCLLLVSSFG